MVFLGAASTHSDHDPLGGEGGKKWEGEKGEEGEGEVGGRKRERKGKGLYCYLVTSRKKIELTGCNGTVIFQL